GSPIKSKVALRISVLLSAGSVGLRPLASNSAKMKKSIAVFGQEALSIFGRTGDSIGRNDQNSRSFLVIVLPPPVSSRRISVFELGHGAPALTHLIKTSNSASVSLRSGGIRGLSS